MIGLFLILALGLVIAFALTATFIIWRLCHPPRRTYAAAAARSLSGDPSELDSPLVFTEWTFRTPAEQCQPLSKHDLPVWDIEGSDSAAPAIFLTPGWGDSRVGALARAPHLAPHCSRLYAWDPPGQGEAPCVSSLGTHEAHALRALIETARDAGALRNGYFLLGWSLGAGVSISAASALNDDPQLLGVIAEAPYRRAQTPARNVMRLAGYPWNGVGPLAFALLGLRFGIGPSWRAFDRAHLAKRLRAPLLVIHGEADDVCPIADGRDIAQAAPDGALLTIEGGAHSDLWTNPDCFQQVVDAANAFITKDALSKLPNASP